MIGNRSQLLLVLVGLGCMLLGIVLLHGGEREGRTPGPVGTLLPAPAQGSAPTEGVAAADASSSVTQEREVPREPLSPLFGDQGAVIEGGLVVLALDPDSLPVVGARIELWSGDERLRAGTSGSDGRLVWGALASGSYAVRAWAEGFAHGLPMEIDVEERERVELTIRLERGVTLTGVVRDANGLHVSQAEVRLVPRLEVQRPVGGERLAQSDAQGRFSFDAVAPGLYLLAARHPEHGRGQVANLRVVQAEEGVQEQDLQLAPVERIAGRVQAREGAPIPGARIQAIGRDGADPTPRVTLAGSDGAFVLDDLGPGHYRVDAHSQGFAPASHGRVRTGADDVLLELAALLEARLSVIDAASGAPVHAFQMTVYGANPQTRRRSRVVHGPRSVRTPDGTFRIDYLRAGTYSIAVRVEGYARADTPPFTLAEGHPAPQLVLALVRGRLTANFRPGESAPGSAQRARASDELFLTAGNAHTTILRLER